MKPSHAPRSVLTFDHPSASVNLSIRIPADLSARIEAVRTRAKQHGAQFEVAKVVRSALHEACTLAEQQLRVLETSVPVAGVARDLDPQKP